MSAEQHEEALSWDGEQADPSLVTGREAREPKARAAVPASQDSAVKPAVGSFLLVTYGILAGAYLIYTLGWWIGIKQVNSTDADALSQIAGAVTQGLAIASAPIWFAAVFLLTRRRAPIVRLLLLLAGLVVLVPWPFVLLGGAK